MFYHLSKDVFNIIEEFAPKLPQIRIKEEDDNTLRICVSKNIEGCLSAMPDGGGLLNEDFIDDEISRIYRVYEFDESDILKGNLINETELYQSNKVVDAEYTKENWIINQNIKPMNSYLIKLIYYKEDYFDLITYSDLMKSLRGEREYGDCLDGHITVITDLLFKKVPLKNLSKYIYLSFYVKLSDLTEKDCPNALIYDNTSVFYNPDYKYSIEDLKENIILLLSEYDDIIFDIVKIDNEYEYLLSMKINNEKFPLEKDDVLKYLLSYLSEYIYLDKIESN